MGQIFNPYQMTLVKLNNIKKALQESIKTGNYDYAENGVALLRTYKDCYFCQAWRKQLEGHQKGTCDACPCHQVAEGNAGRKIAYNGCYQTTYYRELVRLAYWFVKDKSKDTAEALIKAIDGTIGHMNQYRERIDVNIVAQG